MKREAIGCTKMKRLCQRLSIPQYAAVGLLESLWHLTAKEAPQGDIGKLSNEDIALGLEWDGDPEKLVASLISSKWIDESEKHRLVVSEWTTLFKHRDFSGYRDSKRIRRWKRLRAAGGEIPATVRVFIYTRDGHMCRRCQSRSNLTIDHIQPISKGGTNAILNLQTLCRSCNARKKDKVLY